MNIIEFVNENPLKKFWDYLKQPMKEQIKLKSQKSIYLIIVMRREWSGSQGRKITISTTSPQQVQGESSQDHSKEGKFVINHPQVQIIGNPSSGVKTRSSLRNICNNLAFISQIEP